MKAQDLRIGNYVEWSTPALAINIKKLLHKVSSKDLVNLEENKILLEPIPLTEEWLLKFGFEKKKYSGHNAFHILNTWVIQDIYINQYDWGFQTDFLRDCDIELKWVHQLQNLYFALIGEELTIKQN